MSNDYLKPVDLNPTINGAAAPIMMATDPRALHMFGFAASGQRIQNRSAYRVLVSFDHTYDQTPLPVPPGPYRVHAVVEPGADLAYTENHDRGHVLVWLDTSSGPLPPVGTPVDIRVSAWA